jgi:hypothetical protein
MDGGRPVADKPEEPGAKVKANATLDTNRSAAKIDEQITRVLAEARSVDQREDCQCGPEGWEELPRAL